MNFVLAHGFLGFQRLFGVDYFNGVEQFLRQAFPRLTLRILVTQVNPVGRIHVRGRELGQQITAGLKAGTLDPAERVHIIAHSMGGLDARFCLSPGNPDNVAAHVASLSTISTPHHGSAMADLLTSQGRLSETWCARASAVLDLGGGLLDLTTPGAARFNEQYPNHPAVSYFSYAGRGRDGTPTTSLLMLPGYHVLKRAGAVASDGLVSVESAAWGESPEDPWSADHADEIGHDLNGGPRAKPAFDYLARYQAILERLAALR